MKTWISIVIIAVGLLISGLINWKFITPKSFRNPFLIERERIIHITNYVNPESITLPPTYNTQYEIFISTNYSRWVLIITNVTDTWEIRTNL